MITHQANAVCSYIAVRICSLEWSSSKMDQIGNNFYRTEDFNLSE